VEGELLPGQNLGPYRLESILGEGAVGVVFRATREPSGVVVALKVLKQQLSRDETYRRRFVHEARVAAEVQHKHLVPILEAGEADGRSYLAVQYIAGRSLEERIRAAGPLPLDDVLRVAAQAGAGLDALHRMGLVHRDIKSSNVMIDDEGDAALTDFGLAKGPAYTVLTRPGQVMGTLDYLAPELLKGEPATTATDLYAFGCMIYECVAGAPPFAHKSMLQVGLAHLGGEPPDPLANRQDLPKELSWAVLQALAKDPNERPPTATAYGHMLRAAGKGSAGGQL
jgi:serine/threonine protein kinase